MSGNNGKDFELVQPGEHCRTTELTTVHVRPDTGRYDFEQALRKFKRGTAWVRKECRLNASFESKSQKRRRKKKENRIRVRKLERKGFHDIRELDEKTPSCLLKRPKKGFRKGRRSVSEKLVVYPKDSSNVRKKYRIKDMVIYRRAFSDISIINSNLIN